MLDYHRYHEKFPNLYCYVCVDDYGVGEGLPMWANEKTVAQVTVGHIDNLRPEEQVQLPYPFDWGQINDTIYGLLWQAQLLRDKADPTERVVTKEVQSWQLGRDEIVWAEVIL